MTGTFRALLASLILAGVGAAGSALAWFAANLLAPGQPAVPLAAAIAFPAGLAVAALAGLPRLISLGRLRAEIEAVAEARRARVSEVGLTGDLRPVAVAVNAIAERADARASELAEERAEQDSILASVQEGVIVLDADARVQSINPLAASWCGIASETASGQPLEALLRHPPVQGLVRGALSGAAADSESPVIERDGRLLRVRATRLDNPAAPPGVLLVLADVTRLDRLERIRRDFVANVSHELKTPITAVKGYLETLRDGALEDPETARNFVGIALKQADRLNAIIEDLLSLSRIERQTEGDEVEREHLPVRDLLVEATETILPKADAAGVHLRLECAADLAAKVNRALLEQAVLNLVENAVKHTASGKSVTVRAGRDGELLVVAVIDEGCGISAEHLGRLFERFYRVDKSRSRASGGTGLGLSIVKRIARAHGGDVTVESEVGRGSTFRIAIPG